MQRDQNMTTSADDEGSWSELLAAYRRGPKERWSGVILERLGPWLTNARKALSAVPPFFEEEDVAQQLALEVLRIAARWRPGCEDRWVPRRLADAGERRVRKALRRERSALGLELDPAHPATDQEPDILFETPIGKATAADLRVIYRAKVLGESIDVLAREAGISPRRMRDRVRAARQRARA